MYKYSDISFKIGDDVFIKKEKNSRIKARHYKGKYFRNKICFVQPITKEEFEVNEHLSK